jgi:hypothetical protein
MVTRKSKPVRLWFDTIDELKRLKVHPRETYDDVVKRLIKAWKDNAEKLEKHPTQD